VTGRPVLVHPGCTSNWSNRLISTHAVHSVQIYSHLTFSWIYIECNRISYPWLKFHSSSINLVSTSVSITLYFSITPHINSSSSNTVRNSLNCYISMVQRVTAYISVSGKKSHTFYGTKTVAANWFLNVRPTQVFNYSIIPVTFTAFCIPTELTSRCTKSTYAKQEFH